MKKTEKKLLDTRLSYKKRLWDTNVLYIEKTDENIIHETIMSYHSPYDCGFELNDENSKNEESWTAVCANEGSICHYVRKTDQGSELRSRIWSGMDTTEVESEYSLPGSFHPEKEIELFVKRLQYILLQIFQILLQYCRLCIKNIVWIIKKSCQELT